MPYFNYLYMLNKSIYTINTFLLNQIKKIILFGHSTGKSSSWVIMQISSESKIRIENSYILEPTNHKTSHS